MGNMRWRHKNVCARTRKWSISKTRCYQNIPGVIVHLLVSLPAQVQYFSLEPLLSTPTWEEKWSGLTSTEVFMGRMMKGGVREIIAVNDGPFVISGEYVTLNPLVFS